jgi:hypothetical protein
MVGLWWNSTLDLPIDGGVNRENQNPVAPPKSRRKTTALNEEEATENGNITTITIT